MTDITSPFPYDHESNPARLFEAIQRGDDLKLQWFTSGESINMAFGLRNAHTCLYLVPTDVPVEQKYTQLKIIYHALLKQGYQWARMGNHTIRLAIDQPDMDKLNPIPCELEIV